MKLIIIFLSISLFMQVSPLTDCHSEESSHQIEIESAASTMPCHDEANSKDNTAKGVCSDCLSVCCHFFVFDQVTLEPEYRISSIIKNDNWPIFNRYKINFLDENFRPPIFLS